MVIMQHMRGSGGSNFDNVFLVDEWKGIRIPL